MKKTSWILLLGIITVAAFFRFYGLQSTPPGLFPDEAINGSNAVEALDTGNFKVFYPENNGREGLFINVQALFLKYLGHEPWVLRSVSAVFGTLTVLGIYCLGNQLFSQPVGLLSAFLLAISFWHINFSRIGFRAITAPFWLVWSLYLLVIASNRLRAGRTFFLQFLLAGVVYGFGFHSYIAYRATPALIIVIGMYLWIRNPGLRRQLLTSFLTFSAAAFVIFLPLGVYFWRYPGSFWGRASQLSVRNSSSPLEDFGLNLLKTVGMFWIKGDENWRHNIAGRPELFWPVGILFLIGIIAAIVACRSLFKTGGKRSLSRRQKDRIRKQSDPAGKPEAVGAGLIPEPGFGCLLCLSGLVIAGLPAVLSNEHNPHALRSILVVPLVFLLAAYGGVLTYSFLRELFPRSRVLILVAIAFLGSLGFEAYRAYFVRWAKNGNVPGAFASGYVTFGRRLNSLPREMPKYIFVDDMGGSVVNGIPWRAHTVAFITGSYTARDQAKRNIFYTADPRQIPVQGSSFLLCDLDQDMCLTARPR